MSPQPPRVRRDPRDPAQARARVPVAAVAPQPTATTVIDDPSGFVVAVMDGEAGRLSRSDRDLMGAARQLADAIGGATVMLYPLPAGTPFRAKPEQEGADRLLLLSLDPAAEELAEARVGPVIAAAEGCGAKHILFADTFLGGELARRVAARLGDRAAFGVRKLGTEGLVAEIDAGATEISRPLPRVVVVAPTVFAPPPSSPLREARRLEAPEPPAMPLAVRAEGALPLDPAAVPLTEADLILSAGNGLTDWPSFHAAATLLGAAEGGSRVVCDAGLLPRSRQVGVSGLLVEPRCYIALGIAGASQHLQGIAGADRVIAVNSDVRCDMIRRADLAIVADVQRVLPALVRRLEERTSGGVGAGPGVQAPAERIGIAPAANLRTPAGWTGGSTPVVLLASLGRHPVSRRPRRADRDARALELALALGAPVTVLHAGDGGKAEPVLRGHLGAGASSLTVLGCEEDSDPLPALGTWLAAHRPTLVVAGAQAEAGEASGLVPFLLAERLGLPIATHVVEAEIDGDTARLVQALPGGRRRRLEATLPLVITVDRSGPEPRLDARLRALRGTARTESASAGEADTRPGWTAKPSRPRPKRLSAPKSGGDTDAEGRREMIDPDPDKAADAIIQFLEREGLLAPISLQTTDAAA